SRRTVRAFPPRRLLGGDAPQGSASSVRSRSTHCRVGSQTPSARATTLWAQERSRRQGQRSHSDTKAEEAARPATRQPQPGTTRLLPSAGCRRVGRFTSGATTLLVLWLAVRAFPRH